MSITGLRNQHTKWTRLEEQDAHVTYTRLTQMKYTQKGRKHFSSCFLKNPSYMSCRGTFEYLVARWNVLFPFGLDLLTHTQTHRDIRRNERKKKKKKKKPQKMFDRKLSVASFLFSLHTHTHTLFDFVFLSFFAIFYSSH